MNNNIVKGIGASDGYSIGRIYKFEQVKIKITKKIVEDVNGEIVKFDNAVKTSIDELTVIKEKIAIDIDEEHAAIFEAHIQILQDTEYIDAVYKKIAYENLNAEFAFQEVTNMFISIFDTMDDSYIRERAADIKDVSKRVIRNILGIETSELSKINEPVIIVAEDLTPSDTAQLNKKYVKGFITNIGGKTSHSAIMARTLEIPAVVGTGNAFGVMNSGGIVILDGFTGEVFVNPNQEVIRAYEAKHEAYNNQKEIWATLKDKKTVTLDGVHVELAANIGTTDDVEGVIANGAEAVGLYRTEFLYMGKDDFPTEDEQFVAYKKVLERMEGKPVVIRTLDIGGDKELSYFDMPLELNPFLGNRAIRLCMENKSIFRTQLRALLRASVYGNLHIMFPMIATFNELMEAKEFFYKVKKELEEENILVGNDIKIGIMVEVPATVMIIDQLAKEVDFFSIGTNDLIQYSFAADRMNNKLSYLYQPFNPSILRMIKRVIDAAHREQKWVGMCGEMAGEEKAVPILLGLGLDEFSMSGTGILKVRHLISHINNSDAYSLAMKVLTMRTQEEVVKAVEKYLSGIAQ